MSKEPESLLSRIDAYLAKPAAATAERADESIAAEISTEQAAEAAHIRAALSGAFGEAIEVYVGEGEDAGSYLAAVPVGHLKASGLKMVETIVMPRVGARNKGTWSAAVTGSPEAVVNAENRVAKPLGEAWRVKLDSFAAHVGAGRDLYFRITAAGAG